MEAGLCFFSVKQTCRHDTGIFCMNLAYSYCNERRLLTSTNRQPRLRSFVRLFDACCEGSVHLAHIWPFSLCTVSFRKSFFFSYTFALIHTFLLDWFEALSSEKVDSVCVYVWMCVCALSIGVDRRKLLPGAWRLQSLFSIFPHLHTSIN